MHEQQSQNDPRPRENERCEGERIRTGRQNQKTQTKERGWATSGIKNRKSPGPKSTRGNAKRRRVPIGHSSRRHVVVVIVIAAVAMHRMETNNGCNRKGDKKGKKK